MPPTNRNIAKIWLPYSRAVDLLNNSPSSPCIFSNLFCIKIVLMEWGGGVKLVSDTQLGA